MVIVGAILVRKKLLIVPSQIVKTDTNIPKRSFFASLSITFSKMPPKTTPIILG